MNPKIPFTSDPARISVARNILERESVEAEFNRQMRARQTKHLIAWAAVLAAMVLMFIALGSMVASVNHWAFSLPVAVIIIAGALGFNHLASHH